LLLAQVAGAGLNSLLCQKPALATGAGQLASVSSLFDTCDRKCLDTEFAAGTVNDKVCRSIRVFMLLFLFADLFLTDLLQP